MPAPTSAAAGSFLINGSILLTKFKFILLYKVLFLQKIDFLINKRFNRIMENLKIRYAKPSDIVAIDKLLFQVHKVHSDARPDIFKAGAKKYTDKELEEIIANPLTPIFVAEKDNQILGYAFCIHKQFLGDNNMTDIKTLYIDDLCVDENARGLHIGRTLYDYVINYAKENKFYNITLNVWADNTNALNFYQKLGLKVQKLGMETIL